MRIEIKKSTSFDLEDAFGIIIDCKIDLERQGIFQWTAHYPTLQILQDDIEQGYLYQISINGNISGIISINTVQDKEYRNISWESPEKYSLVIHRLAIDPKCQGLGLAQKLMDYAELYGVENGFKSIRLDSYSANSRALRFYEQRNYVKRGELMFPNRALPFYCFEKQL